MARQQEAAPSGTLTQTEGAIGLGSPAAAGGEPLAEDARRVATRVSSPGRDAWRRFRHNYAALVSLVVITIMVIMALFAPFMHTENPLNQDYTALYQAPGAHHWFGTDGIGRDIYSRLVYGLRVPLIVGLIGTTITVIIGTAIGLWAGYFGGWVDSLLSRFTDLIFAFPAFLLALLIVALFRDALAPIFGGAGRVVLLTAVFAFVSWPALTRFIRSLSLSMKEQQFVEAARTAGSSNFKIIRRHLLPNMFGLLLVQAALITVGIVYTETTLSIFGLGVAPPDPDPGQMLYDAAINLNANVQAGFYAETIFASLALVILLVAFSFVGDGVRDAVDPRMNA